LVQANSGNGLFHYLDRTLTGFELKLLKRPDIHCISGHVI
jgi:hypothetical protein